MVALTGTKAGRHWYLAGSLVTLINQLDEEWPGRSKASDGSIASPTHTQINPNSDHEPAVWDSMDQLWVVTAVDMTDDDSGGPDMYEVTEQLRLSKDPRIKYVIHFRGTPKMFSSYASKGYAPYTWRPYSGSNPHTSHAHLSVLPSRSLRENLDPWRIQVAKHLYMPAGSAHAIPPRSWADNTWEAYALRRGTNVSSRNWAMSREDISWIDDRVIVPLEKRVASLEGQVASLTRQLNDLENSSGGLSKGTVFTATVL